MKKLWSLVKIFLKVAVTCILIYYVFQKIDFEKVKHLFIISNKFLIFLALLTYFVSSIVSSWRLLGFLNAIGININFSFNFKLYMLGMFYNTFIPGGIGGDGYKIYLLRKRFKKPTKKIVLAIFLDRVSGIWSIGFIFVVLTFLIPEIKIPPYLSIGSLVLGTCLYYFLLQYFFKEYNKNFIKAHLKAGTVQSLQMLTVICILLTQNFTGKFSPYLFSFLASSIASIIPISAGGFGTREYVMTHASTVFDMNQTLAVYITLTFSVLSTIASLPGVYFMYQAKEFEPLPNAEEAEKIEDEDDEVI